MREALDRNSGPRVFPEPPPQRDDHSVQSPVPGLWLEVREGPLRRLFLRRWLAVLAGAIIFALTAVYGLPWYAGLLGLLAFLFGAAFFPRGGLLTASPLAILPPVAAPKTDAVARAMIEALPEPALLLSADGSVLAHNGKASEFLEGLAIGAHISRAIRNPRVLDAVAACREEQAPSIVAFTIRVPAERHMAATVSFVGRTQDRAGPAILLFLRDLTGEHRLDQLRAGFIANASHELKTPLTALLGFIETLQNAASDDSDARGRFLAIMEREASRMARLVDHLTSLNRVEMHEHLKPNDAVAIEEIVAEARDTLGPMAAEAGVSLEVPPAGVDAIVAGDRDELVQVFINLIHNAIKYGKKGGRVSISIQRVENGTNPRIGITVADDGPGIAAHHLPRLTERFYRIPEARALAKGGSGLGLAIVKHVLNRHGGELRIKSEEGAGSQFTVLLPQFLAGGAEG